MRLLVSAILVLAPTLAWAQPASGPVVTSPRWQHLPAPEEVFDLYPPMALILGVSGAVQLRCVSNPDGSITDCETVAADPAGWGFEAAAVATLQRGRLAPRTVDGVPQASTFSVRIPFLSSAIEEGPAYEGPAPDPDMLNLIRDYVAFSAGVESLFCLDLDRLSPEERAAALPALTQAFEENRTAWVEGMALGWARSAPPGAYQAIRSGGPVEPVSEMDPAAFDQVRLIEARIFARARDIYCGQYDCASI
jgi:TonB family protein